MKWTFKHGNSHCWQTHFWCLLRQYISQFSQNKPRILRKSGSELTIKVLYPSSRWVICILASHHIHMPDQDPIQIPLYGVWSMVYDPYEFQIFWPLIVRKLLIEFMEHLLEQNIHLMFQKELKCSIVSD